MKSLRKRSLPIVVSGLLLMQTGVLAGKMVIVSPPDASGREKLAAREIRRYLYARTGELVPVAEMFGDADGIVVATQGHDILREFGAALPSRKLEAEQYILKTVEQGGRRRLIVAGGESIGTLYAAYRFAEHLGVRFYLEGDVVPDERIPLALPDLDEKGSPLFELRGIQPFHDFPEGPDWWDTDMYQSVISQLPKLRMNFFGLHTYPEGGVGPEPVVWIGPPEDVAPDGRVKAAYPSRHFSTVSGTWGSQPKKTGEYLFGASTLYDHDAYCQDVQLDMTPWPATPEKCNEFFDRFGDKLRIAFQHARDLGVKTCIGTETPLIAPTSVRERLKPQDTSIEVVGGSVADYNSPTEGTEEDVVYQSVRWDVRAYRLRVPDGRYSVTLKFCEIHYDAAGKRVFGVKLQGKTVLEDLDIFARVGKNRALDLTYRDVEVSDGLLRIEFASKVEFPCIAGIVVEGPRTLKINCGSAKPYKDYLTDEGRMPLQVEDIERLYTGMFARIMRTHPLDYYWFWTPENWTWSGVSQDEVRRTMDDLGAAIRAAEKLNAPFGLATCGWVLGPQTDRALFDNELPRSVAVSCINRAVGHDAVEPAFAEVKARGKWAIPWLEDDPAMISAQLWAGRMRKDAADAKAYGCTGLMGIHWRTRVLGPNVSALAQAAWDQSGWPKPPVRTTGADGGSVEAFADRSIEGTNEAIIYQSQRTGLRSYAVPTPNGTHAVTLKFCELVHNEKGKRVFTVKLQGRPVLEDFDIFAEAGRGKAIDKAFKEIPVTDGWLVVEFVPTIGEPCLAGLHDQAPYGGHGYNCGGPAWAAYAADPPAKPAAGRYLPVDDFYRDWAVQSFGDSVGDKIGAVFTRIDGNLPRPSNWIGGPGGIFPDARPWEQVRREYAFVDELAALRSQIRGAGNLERFDFWLDTFRYLRANGRLDCLLARQNEVMAELKKQTDDGARRAYARNHALPVRIEIVGALREVYQHLLATVTNASELGTIANWEQHSLPGLLAPGDELAKAFGEPLPPEAMPTQEFTGTPRLIVPVARTSAKHGEPVVLKVTVLDRKPASPVLCWRPMGTGAFRQVPARHRDRGVYDVTLPAGEDEVEYYIEADSSAGMLRFPASAPELNQTLIRAD